MAKVGIGAGERQDHTDLDGCGACRARGERERQRSHSDSFHQSHLIPPFRAFPFRLFRWDSNYPAGPRRRARPIAIGLTGFASFLPNPPIVFNGRPPFRGVAARIAPATRRHCAGFARERHDRTQKSGGATSRHSGQPAPTAAGRRCRRPSLSKWLKAVYSCPRARLFRGFEAAGERHAAAYAADLATTANLRALAARSRSSEPTSTRLRPRAGAEESARAAGAGGAGTASTAPWQ